MFNRKLILLVFIGVILEGFVFQIFAQNNLTFEGIYGQDRSSLGEEQILLSREGLNIYEYQRKSNQRTDSINEVILINNEQFFISLRYLTSSGIYCLDIAHNNSIQTIKDITVNFSSVDPVGSFKQSDISINVSTEDRIDKQNIRFDFARNNDDKLSFSPLMINGIVYRYYVISMPNYQADVLTYIKNGKVSLKNESDTIEIVLTEKQLRIIQDFGIIMAISGLK
jgi:hypothetical protein